MRASTVGKTLIAIPFLIASGFVFMFMSYMLIPMMIVGTVAYVLYHSIEQDKKIKNEPSEEDDHHWTY